MHTYTDNIPHTFSGNAFFSGLVPFIVWYHQQLRSGMVMSVFFARIITIIVMPGILVLAGRFEKEPESG